MMKHDFSSLFGFWPWDCSCLKTMVTVEQQASQALNLLFDLKSSLCVRLVIPDFHYGKFPQLSRVVLF